VWEKIRLKSCNPGSWPAACFAPVIETPEQTIARQAREIEILRQKVDFLTHRLFGSKSEKIDDAQLKLLFGDETTDQPGKDEASSDAGPEEAEEDGGSRKRKRGGHRSRVTGLDRLSVETTEIIPDLVRENPEEFERIGEKVTDQLDVVPARYFIQRTVRPVFRRRDARRLPPVVAPAPATPLVGGLPSAALLALLLVAEYVDHLPLYRQQGIFLRAGLGIPRDLIIHWIHKTIGLLLPVVEAIHAEVLESNYLQVDETPVRYLRPGTGKSWQGYLWQLRRPGGSVYYHWSTGRSRADLTECLGGDYCGHMQCDAYSVYESYARSHLEVILIACLAHIRRGFTDSLKLGPCRDAALIVHLFKLLYRIEAELREQKAGPALRESVRAWKSAPLVRRIGRIMRVMLPKHRPSTPTGKALAYALRHWSKFERYLDDGRFEIDNNLTENGMRPMKLGMKNWLFFGSEEAGHHAAAIYTLVENCKAHGLPVESYLREVLTTLPGVTDGAMIASLTPARVAAARRGSRAA
jgi:transposase